jgi:VanZ family protein
MSDSALRRLWVAATLLLALAIVYWSLAPQPPVPNEIIPDKVGHYLAYLALALLGSGIATTAGLWRLALRCLALGAALEIAQGLLTEHRMAEWGDLLADLAGILTAWAIAGQGRAGWAMRLHARLVRGRTP